MDWIDVNKEGIRGHSVVNLYTLMWIAEIYNSILFRFLFRNAPYSILHIIHYLHIVYLCAKFVLLDMRFVGWMAVIITPRRDRYVVTLDWSAVGLEEMKVNNHYLIAQIKYYKKIQQKAKNF